MAADAGQPVEDLRVDGGAAANDLLMQLQADFLGAPVTRPVMLETTALGAAFLAGLGTGVWNSPDEVSKRWQQDAMFSPKADEGQRELHRSSWSAAVSRLRS